MLCDPFDGSIFAGSIPSLKDGQKEEREEMLGRERREALPKTYFGASTTSDETQVDT